MGNGGIPLPTLPGTSEPPPPPPQQPPQPPLNVGTNILGPPGIPTDIPKKSLELYYRDVHTSMYSMGLPDWAAHIIAAIHTMPTSWMSQIANQFAGLVGVIMDPVAGIALGAIAALRVDLDPLFSKFAVSVLGELMGTDLAATDMPTGNSMGSHLARADRIGGIFHNLLLSEFAGKDTLTPEDGVAAAKRFSGLVINFGTATGLLAAIGGMAPIIHLDEIREIGEEVAKNLGLGRLHRIAMMPLFHIMMAVPYTWYLNLKLRPTQFAVSELVNPFTGVTMNAQIVHDSLARLGYSDDKIAALLDLHKKRPPFADLFRLVQRQLITPQAYEQLLSEQGISTNDAFLFEQGVIEQRIDALEREVLAAVAESFRFGNIGEDELNAAAQKYIHTAAEQVLWITAQQYKRKVPHRSLTLAQCEKLLVDGIFDISDFDDRLNAMGYDVADTAAMRLLSLETLQLDNAKAAAKAAAAAAKAAKAAAKSSTTTPPAAT